MLRQARLNAMQTDISSPVVGLIACSVFEREIAMLQRDLPPPKAVELLEIALHDRPDVLRESLRQALEAMERVDGLDAVVLVYGLCGLGTTGLSPRRYPLVLPRAHDCMTLFLGSKERYAAHQKSCPGCYYYTPGWNRARRVPGPDKLALLEEEFSRSFEPDDVEFLLDSERAAWAMHDTATYIDLGTDDAAAEASYARRCAEFLGWKFEAIHGDPSLLRDLLTGPWDDERFQIVLPGNALAHRADETILAAVPIVDPISPAWMP